MSDVEQNLEKGLTSVLIFLIPYKETHKGTFLSVPTQKEI